MKIVKVMNKINPAAYGALPLRAGGYIMLLVSSIIYFAGCTTGDLSRGQAVTAISEAANYKQPALTSIDIGSLPDSNARAYQLSKEDTGEAAAIRAKEDFKKKQPQLIIAEQLGYIVLHFEDPVLSAADMSSDQPSDLFAKGLGVWNFKERAELTDAGRALWKDAGLNVNELALPLAVRGTPEITGIIDEDKITKKVELTYTWRPNKLGQSLDPNSAAFNELPEDLKQILKNPKFNLFGTITRTANFTEARKGSPISKSTTTGGDCRT